MIFAKKEASKVDSRNSRRQHANRRRLRINFGRICGAAELSSTSKLSVASRESRFTESNPCFNATRPCDTH